MDSQSQSEDNYSPNSLWCYCDLCLYSLSLCLSACRSHAYQFFCLKRLSPGSQLKPSSLLVFPAPAFWEQFFFSSLCPSLYRLIYTQKHILFVFYLLLLLHSSTFCSAAVNICGAASLNTLLFPVQSSKLFSPLSLYYFFYSTSVIISSLTFCIFYDLWFHLQFV